MYTVFRSYFKYGKEDDEVELTVKEFDTEEKAIAYAHRYAKGNRFCSATIEDDGGNTIYEILNYGSVTYDYRQKDKQEDLELEL